MTKPLPKINTSSLDDLFTTEEQRQEEKLEKVIKIPIDDIADFKKHPFNVRLDEEMESLIKSVEENGIKTKTYSGIFSSCSCPPK